MQVEKIVVVALVGLASIPGFSGLGTSMQSAISGESAGQSATGNAATGFASAPTLASTTQAGTADSHERSQRRLLSEAVEVLDEHFRHNRINGRGLDEGDLRELASQYRSSKSQHKRELAAAASRIARELETLDEQLSSNDPLYGDGYVSRFEMLRYADPREAYQVHRDARRAASLYYPKYAYELRDLFARDDLGAFTYAEGPPRIEEFMKGIQLVLDTVDSADIESINDHGSFQMLLRTLPALDSKLTPREYEAARSLLRAVEYKTRAGSRQSDLIWEYAQKIIYNDDAIGVVELERVLRVAELSPSKEEAALIVNRAYDELFDDENPKWDAIDEAVRSAPLGAALAVLILKEELDRGGRAQVAELAYKAEFAGLTKAERAQERKQQVWELYERIDGQMDWGGRDDIVSVDDLHKIVRERDADFVTVREFAAQLLVDEALVKELDVGKKAAKGDSIGRGDYDDKISKQDIEAWLCANDRCPE